MRFIITIICVLTLCAASIHVDAQCYPNRHSTNWYDAWTSCETSPNPNATRSNSHWIMYDLEKLHRLDRSYIWNYNDVNNLNYGIQEVAIDYSLDGSNWQSAGNYTFTMANGTPTYQGESGPNLGGIEARYVLLTALTNPGGDCYALVEIRLEAEEINVAVTDRKNENICLSVDVFPNPMKADARVYVESDCKGEIEYQLMTMQGKILLKGDITNQVAQTGYFNLTSDNMIAGEYILEVGNKEGLVRKVLVKI